MRHTLTVDIIVELPVDLDPSLVTFAGIENAIPQAEGQNVGHVVAYTTQEYFE